MMENYFSLKDLSEDESGCMESNSVSSSSPLPVFACHHCGYRTDGRSAFKTHIVEVHSELFHHIGQNSSHSTDTSESRTITEGSSLQSTSIHLAGCGVTHIGDTTLESPSNSKVVRKPYYSPISSSIHDLNPSKVTKPYKERPYFCPHCEFKSAHCGNLREHIRSRHTDERPYSCPQCEYKSAHPGALKRHVIYKHTNERPFICPHCEYKSADCSNLKEHILSQHTNDRPYICPHCEYKSVQSGALKRHIISLHTDERPFTCPHCEFKSAHPGNLKIHIMSKHTYERPYTCTLCEYKSAYSGALKRHIPMKGILPVHIASSNRLKLAI